MSTLKVSLSGTAAHSYDNRTEAVVFSGDPLVLELHCQAPWNVGEPVTCNMMSDGFVVGVYSGIGNIQIPAEDLTSGQYELFFNQKGSSASGYTATITKVLGSLSDDDMALTLDRNKRIMNTELHMLGVQGDMESEVLDFRFPRYADGIDLSEKIISIHYITSEGTASVDTATDLHTDDEYVYFSWVISSEVTAHVGEVNFAVHCTEVNPEGLLIYSWATQPAKLPVKETVTSIEQIREKNPDAINQWLEIMAKASEAQEGYVLGIGSNGILQWVKQTGGSGGNQTAVLYTPQDLMPEEKKQARENISASDNETTQRIISKMTLVEGKNLLNPDKFIPGYITSFGKLFDAQNYRHIILPVKAGEVYTAYNNRAEQQGLRFVCAYNAKGEPVENAGTDDAIQEYIVPDGIVKIAYSFLPEYVMMLAKNAAGPIVFEPYHESYYMASSEFVDGYTKEEVDKMISDISVVIKTTGRNLLNMDNVVPGYLDPNGVVIAPETVYKSTEFIPVMAGAIYAFSYSDYNMFGRPNAAAMGRTAFYDENKKKIWYKFGNIKNVVAPEGAKYARFSFYAPSYPFVQVEKSENGNYGYFEPYEEKYVPAPKYFENKIHCCLPPVIYVAVGRTIELYNELVCLEAAKYHVQWVCYQGNASDRKFSITGLPEYLNQKDDSSLEPGQKRLFLNLYDDNKEIVWTGQSMLQFCDNVKVPKTVLPIGDSLTNWKAWLPEVMNLANQNIKFVGTRYSGLSTDADGKEYQSGEIHHEGRSGATANDYLINSKYTLDDRYSGVPEVAGTDNPFWDGSKFSLAHYLITQKMPTPDVVQIFLGTNDIRSGVDTAVKNIKKLVDSIRLEYPNMPVNVVDTIYRSTQSGYASVGVDGYGGSSTGAGPWQFDEDVKVFTLQLELNKALFGMDKVYIAPLTTCHDRKYNFGEKSVKVNPRAIQEMAIPVESIHPTTQGYYQFADVFYSAYCAITKENP